MKRKKKPLKTYQYRLYPNQEAKSIFEWTSNEKRKLFNYFLKQYRKEDKWISKLSFKEQEKEWEKLKNKQVKELVLIKEKKPKLYQIQAQVLQDLPYREIPAFWKSFLLKREEYKKLKKRIIYPRYKTEKGWYSRVIYPQRVIKNKGILTWTFQIEKGQLLIKQGSAVKQSKRTLPINIRLHTQKKNGQKKPRPLPIEKLKTLTISWKNDKYFAGLTCEIEPKIFPKTDKEVGVDMGITSYIATSEGKLYDRDQKVFKKKGKKIVKTQRRLSRRVKDSEGWKEARGWLRDKWESFKNYCRHETYQVVNDLLANYEIIVREDLKIENLVRNRCLAKKIYGVRWGITFNLLEYMARGAGRKVIKVSPYNTSQICSECDELREPRLKPNERIFNCFKCGFKLNRDVNAAKNILKRYLTERRGTSLWGTLVNSKEGVKKPVMVRNREFSTEKPPSSNLIRD